jgi:NTP pyrophosphatase (non-canonical NTP hydrolase)
MKEAQQIVANFLDKRPIMKEHDTPDNVANQLKGEVDEFLDEHINNKDLDPKEKEKKVRLEIADIGFYFLTLCNIFQLDGTEIIKEKTTINEWRFPSDLFQEGDFIEIYNRRKQELAHYNQLSMSSNITI